MRRQEAVKSRRTRRMAYGLGAALAFIFFLTLIIGWTSSQADVRAADQKIAESSSRHQAGVNHSEGWLPSNTPYRDSILRASRESHLDPALLAGLIETESDFNPDTVSSAGAIGLTQVLQENADDMQISDLSDPDNQIQAGAKLLAGLIGQFDSTQLALAAYNAGPGAVQRYGGIPPYRETQNYVPRVLEFRKHYLPGGSGKPTE